VKIARFSTDGDPRFGILDEDEAELIVLTGDPMFSGYDTTGERVPLANAKLLAPVIPRSKVIGMGGNYRPEDGSGSQVSEPQMFLKPNTSVIGPGDAVRLPKGVGRVVYEGELAIVIGSLARQVSAERAMDVVFGYTIGNDVTAADRMSDTPWTTAKLYDSFSPLGPIMETELDPSELSIDVSVDGEHRGGASTASMIRSIPEIIELASSVFTLLPGDVILTGAGAGVVGDLVDGATVDITIDGIGTLSNPAITR